MRCWGLLAALAAPALLAGGCVSVLPEAGPPPEIYRLDGGSASRTVAALGAAETADWAVSIPEPLAPRALATDRIAVIAGGEHIAYAAGARWNERAPLLVQERILTAFEDDGRVQAAVRPEDGVRTRFELRLDLLRFEAVYDAGENAAPVVEVEVRAKLVDRDGRDLVGSTRLHASRRAAGNRLAAIVTAFDAALAEVGGEVVDWTLEAGGAPAAEAARVQLPERAASSSR